MTITKLTFSLLLSRRIRLIGVISEEKFVIRMINIYTKIKYFAVCTALFLGAAFPCQASTSSILIDAKTGNVISASDPDSLRYPASLTKLMTLYITFNALDKGLIKMEDKLPVSRNAENRSPSKLGVRRGEKISVKDAILALIVKSANDCATVLAEGLGYSEENFAKTMTEVAREIGMKNTTFKNASGLPNKAQKTTARDMAVLGAAMYHHFPQYYKLFSTKKFTYKGRTYYTHNHLLKQFDGADGMKTGYTAASGYNIVTSAERGGNRVIAVTMGHQSIKQRDKSVYNMMNKGLTKLASANPPADRPLYADLQPTSVALLPAGTAEATAEAAAQANWGIQIGAFSNYAKARNYALKIRNETKSKSLKTAHVDVEPARKGAAVIYRSKLIGLEKNEADKTCNNLKKSNKSCIVVASNIKHQLVMADTNHE